MQHAIASICHPSAPLVLHHSDGRHAGAALLRTALILAATSAAYGASFGIWRDPLQAFYAAVKMPILFLGIVTLTGFGNAFVAQVLGVEISVRQTIQSMLVSFAVTTTILCALAPIFVFLACNVTPPAEDHHGPTYAILLLLHTLAVGIAGTIGNLRLWKLLRAFAGNLRCALLVSIAWFGLCGAAGSELSWICSPFLARPDQPVIFLNPNAFRMNMYEYLWHQLRPRDFQQLEKAGAESSSDWKERNVSGVRRQVAALIGETCLADGERGRAPALQKLETSGAESSSDWKSDR